VEVESQEVFNKRLPVFLPLLQQCLAKRGEEEEEEESGVKERDQLLFTCLSTLGRLCQGCDPALGAGGSHGGVCTAADMKPLWGEKGYGTVLGGKRVNGVELVWDKDETSWEQDEESGCLESLPLLSEVIEFLRLLHHLLCPCYRDV